MNSRNLSVDYVSVTSLTPNKKNPRLHSPKQVEQIARSIKVFGCIVPFLVDCDLQVIAGHGRLLASKLLGLDQVPVIRLEHLSEHEKRAFMIADNRLTENSEWDDQLLGEQLKILSEAEIDFSLEIIGFEMAEIDMRIENLAAGVEGESDPGDALPEPSLVAVTQPGDVWEMGKHRASMIVTDPPYNVRISLQNERGVLATAW